MSSKRIKYIDMLKAFCIILVIAGHMGYTPAKVKLLLYIFHIPLFFFLSGITLNVAKYASFFEFFVRKFKTIVVPCFLMNISIFFIKSFILQPQSILKIDIIYFIKAMIVADRMHIYYQLWFLNVLFLAELVCYFAIKYSNRFYQYVIVYVVLILCGFITHGFNGISSHTAVRGRSPRFSGLRPKFTAYVKLGVGAAMFAHARCFNRGMSEQVIELLPETTPAADAPAESVVPPAAPESADEGSAVPAETQPSVNAEETEVADTSAEESAAGETAQNEDSTPDPFTPLDEEVGAPSGCSAQAAPHLQGG